MFSTVGRQRAEGLEPLSARERAEGCTGNDRGPMESSAASTSAGNHKLGRSRVSSAFTEKREWSCGQDQSSGETYR